MNRKRVATLAALIAVSVSFPATSLACGESLYRVGQGLRYKSPSAPLPANVLIMPTSERQKQIISKLIEAGHSVRIVNDEQQLAQEMGSADYDIVIAPLDRKGSAGGATFVPVAADREEQRLAKNEFRRSLKSSDDVIEYLKTIHYAMSDRDKS
ncbi:MAG: hypothetical protein R3200_12770 [Xanthomonadales bacterium]|nr:hypothetical protein [Xanthomonadales bacterium]